tara:strand:- start:117 stop:386 length:270 start_codon:yes stop_codon:yes gene_type:complete
MPNEDLELQIVSLNKELAKLNSHRFIKIHNSYPKMIGFQILRGLAFGLGSVIGATVLVSLLIFLLSNINFIPIIGEWATEIMLVLEPKL